MSLTLCTRPSRPASPFDRADARPAPTDRVALARQRLAAGYYDRDDVTDLTVDLIAAALTGDTSTGR